MEIPVTNSTNIKLIYVEIKSNIKGRTLILLNAEIY